jgi:hypothetical protein
LTNVCAPAVFSADGQWLLAGTPDHKKLQLWNTQTWEPVAACPQTPILPGVHRSAVGFSPDGKLLMTPWLDFVGQTGGVRLWEVPTLKHYIDLFPPEQPLHSAVFLPDSKRLLTGSWFGHLLIWDLSSNPPTLLRQLAEHTATIPTIAVARGARTFATGSGDQSICLWDISGPKLVARWRGHTREVFASAMSPDGLILASSARDGSVRLWRGQPEDAMDDLVDTGIVAGFSSDSRTVVFAPSEGDYRWQLVTGTNRVVIPIDPTPPLKFDFNLRPYAVQGREPFAALGRTGGRIELWNLAARRLFNSWNVGTNWITAVEFSPEGRLLATADSTGMVTFWDLATRTKTASFRASHGAVGAMVFSPDGQWLATGAYHSPFTRIWNVNSLDVVVTLKAQANEIAFAPNGKSVGISSVEENEAQVWDLPAGRRRLPLKGHLGGMAHVAFSPDGLTLATGAYDGAIKLWNLATGQEVATFPHAGTLNSLRFSPDGQMLAASFWTFPGIRTRIYHAPSLKSIREKEASRFAFRNQILRP